MCRCVEQKAGFKPAMQAGAWPQQLVLKEAKTEIIFRLHQVFGEFHQL